jgi:hypothetical protein
MKHNILYNIGALLTGFLLITACSQESFNGVDEAGLAVAENAKVTLNVDQTTNQVTFNMAGEGIYPIWMIPQSDKITYSTANGLQKIFSNAGDYNIQYRVGNRNGISQGAGKVTFHINNSIIDYTKYTTMMAGKEWHIDSTATAHLACGPSGTDGTSWYSAQPKEKAGTGMYDNRITFTADGKYSFDPGKNGTTYVNTGCTILNNPGTGKDYSAKVDKQTVNYTFDAQGNNIYLVFPAKTLFPYIPTDDAYNKELRLRLENITSSTMVLIYDNGNIAWHYILSSAEANQ